MSKQIILDALASQFAIKQNEFIQYETTVYQPALDKFNESIRDWFGSVLFIRPHSAKYTGDTLEIVPTEDGRWPSAINISWVKWDRPSIRTKNRTFVSILIFY